jgi:hypothetical protein
MSKSSTGRVFTPHFCHQSADVEVGYLFAAILITVDMR